DREGHDRLHLGHSDADHAAVLHQRPDSLHRRLGDEERGAIPMTRRARARLRSEQGQTILEFGLMLPLVVVLVLGVVELSYALLDQHVVTKLAREGSNLISRDTDLVDAATVMRTMSTRPVDFTNGNSKVIFSVVRNIDVTGTTNYNKPILYQ